MVKGSLANDGQACRVDFIEGIARSVPGGEIEVDQVDGRQASAVEVQMVIDHVAAQIAEMAARAERIAGGKNTADGFRGRILGKFNDDIPVADHIPEHAELELRQAFTGDQRMGVMPAAPQTVVGWEIDVKLADGFLAVEKDEFETPGEIFLRGEDAGEFEERARAGAAVVRPDEALVSEPFRVVMGTDDGAGIVRVGVGGSGDEVDEFDGAVRRWIGEFLALDRPAERAKLRLDVLAGLLQFGGAARMRAEGDELGDVVESVLAGELFGEHVGGGQRSLRMATGERQKDRQNQGGKQANREATWHRVKFDSLPPRLQGAENAVISRMEAPSLRTERLVLRPWRRSDLAPFAAMNADPRVMEFYPQTLTWQESDAMAGRIQAHLDEVGFGLWAVEAPGTADFVGFVGLSVPRWEAAFTPCVEVGWRLGAEHWGRGYAIEAARAAVTHGFEGVGLKEIVSFTVPMNLRSRSVMERLGMTRRAEDDFDHPLLSEGHPLRRHVLYRLPAP